MAEVAPEFPGEGRGTHLGQSGVTLTAAPAGAGAGRSRGKGRGAASRGAAHTLRAALRAGLGLVAQCRGESPAE